MRCVQFFLNPFLPGGSSAASSDPQEVGGTHRRSPCRPWDQDTEDAAMAMKVPCLCLSRPPGCASVRSRDTAVSAPPPRAWARRCFSAAEASSQGLALCHLERSFRLDFKCHNPILRLMVVSKESSSALVPAPRALSTGEGDGVEQAPPGLRLHTCKTVR